jgi:hypothetical protein
MGYTTGRRLTKDFIIKEVQKYQTRAEFIKKDSSCYVTARRLKILDEACNHMKPCFFSTPQKICKYIRYVRNMTTKSNSKRSTKCCVRNWLD